MTAATVPAANGRDERATAFAAAVREHLSDLPSDELDDLLDGLQADLAERLADGGELGDPIAYAEELRQAAGLPARSDAGARKRRVRDSLADSMKDLGARGRAFWETTPARRGIRDFVLALRPLWWVLRGFGMAWTALAIISGLPNGWWFDFWSIDFRHPVIVLFFLAAIVVSVQWGRGRWAPTRWLVWLRRVASVAAVIALIPALAIVSDRLAPRYYDEYAEDPYYQSGLWLDDVQIGNIFAYDCNGQPLDGVQLFTRDGQPLTTLQDGQPPLFWDEQGGDLSYTRNQHAALPNGWSGWNVFPLQQTAPQELDDEGNLSEWSAEPAPLPFTQVPAISDDCPVVGAAAGDEAASGDTEGTGADQATGGEGDETDQAADDKTDKRDETDETEKPADTPDAGAEQSEGGAAGSDAKEQ